MASRPSDGSRNSSAVSSDDISNVANTASSDTISSNTITSNTTNTTTSNPFTVNTDTNIGAINTTAITSNSGDSLISGPSREDPPTYTQEDKNYCKLVCLFRNLVTEVFFFVFRLGLSKKSDNDGLVSFYEKHGINGFKFQKNMTLQQKEMVERDSSGETYDISLIYLCLRWGFHGLKDGTSENWKCYENSLESLITKVKDKRNFLAHGQCSYTTEQLVIEMDKLKTDLITIIQLCGTKYHLPVAEVNEEISRVKGSVAKHLADDYFDPKTFIDYKKSLIYDTLTDLVNTKGKREIKDCLEKGTEHKICPLNHIAKIGRLPLDGIYTDMEMQGGIPGLSREILYEDILVDEKGNSEQKTNSVIVIDGPPGAGKTTLIKMITLDWKGDCKKEIKQMKHLLEYDIILKTECNSRARKTFEDLIKLSMPDTSENFMPADLKNVVLRQKLMSIMDGLDELNETSELLFHEMLELKKIYGFTLVITTRHEKVAYLERELNRNCLEMKHIVLVGVPKIKREELCKKYYYAIAEHPDEVKFRQLSVHLKKTEQRLADLWSSPYHLTLLTIFFVFGDGDITKINTAPRLYKEILMLYRNKLKARIGSRGLISPLDEDVLKKIKQVIDIKRRQSPNVSQDDQREPHQLDENLKRLCLDIEKSINSSRSTVSLDETTLDRKIDQFIYILAQQSLIALRDDHIGLPQEVYKELEEFCYYNKLSVHEMVGGFLHRSYSEEVVYQYPHKGLQDYLGALYIWRELTGNSNNPKVKEFLSEIKSLGLNRGIPQNMIKGMSEFAMDFVQKQVQRQDEALISGNRVSLIETILEDVQISCTDDMSKYQNLASCLLGLFSSEKDEVEVKYKLEALKFIQRTGVRDKKDWLRIFSSVECDEFVAFFINKEYKIFYGDILIQDNSLTAYVSLMKSLKLDISSARKVNIDLDIKGELDELLEILKWIKHHQFRLRTIVISDNYQAFTNIVKDKKFPSLVPKMVDIDIKVSVGLPEIHELLEALREGQFFVRTLEAKDKLITDDNAAGCQRSLAALPQLRADAFRGIVHMRMKKECPILGSILDDLDRHQFQVRELELLDFFKHPISINHDTSVGEDVDKVVRRCHQDMEVYVGPLTEEVLSCLIPDGKRLRHLCVSVLNEVQLERLSAAVAERRYPLYTLCVSLDATCFADRSVGTYPLNEVFQVSLFMRNVDVTFYKKTTDLVKRLMPDCPHKGFWCLCFPLLQAPAADIARKLIYEGVNIRGSIVFPMSSKPLQGCGRSQLSMDADPTAGRLSGVKWGKSRLFFEEFSEEIQDLDEWA